MSVRGDGIGLDVVSTGVRAVRLGRDEPGRVEAVADVPIVRFDDHAAVFDALVRVRGRLGTRPIPTRVAWFPNRSTMQRLDVTGLTGPELNRIRHDLAGSSGITSTMLIDADARRWMLALRWDHREAWRLQELVERAGFVDVSVEPAPVAVERVLGRDTTVVRRDASADRSWAAIFDESVPVAATSVDADGREHPGLTLTAEVIDLFSLDQVLGEAQLADDLGRIVHGAFDGSERSDALGLQLQLLGDPYPPFPAHDLRAPERLAVALGAALGAAGLAGRLRPVDVLTSTSRADSSVARPWAIERRTDTPPPVERPGSTRWTHRALMRWRRLRR